MNPDDQIYLRTKVFWEEEILIKYNLKEKERIITHGLMKLNLDHCYQRQWWLVLKIKYRALPYVWHTRGTR